MFFFFKHILYCILSKQKYPQRANMRSACVGDCTVCRGRINTLIRVCISIFLVAISSCLCMEGGGGGSVSPCSFEHGLRLTVRVCVCVCVNVCMYVLCDCMCCAFYLSPVARHPIGGQNMSMCMCVMRFHVRMFFCAFSRTCGTAPHWRPNLSARLPIMCSSSPAPADQ